MNSCYDYCCLNFQFGLAVLIFGIDQKDYGFWDKDCYRDVIVKFAQGLIVPLKEKLRASLDRAILLQLWQAHNL